MKKDEIDFVQEPDTGECQLALFEEVGGDLRLTIADIDLFVKEHWALHTVKPYFLEKWLRMGWEHMDIHEMLCLYVGDDYINRPMSYWITQMEAVGVYFPSTEEILAPPGESCFDVMSTLIYKTALDGFSA